MRQWYRFLTLLLAPCLGTPLAARAQDWNGARVRALVTLATERRALQFADSQLIDYTAQAHGLVTFLAQIGGGRISLPAKLVKADEIFSEIYWRPPAAGKQWITGRRDTTFFPTDIQYHRDHLGVILNNFPNTIRLGDGDEVKDVPHPLSASGLTLYDFALTDSLRVEIPGKVLDVYEVKVKPRDDKAEAAVGALYLSKEDGQVVRMAFSFTRAALKDKQLVDVSVIMENSLYEGQFWLPRRQEIEIRRSVSWMDFPVQGIIRGQWDVTNHVINSRSTVALSPGPEIIWAPAERRLTTWPTANIMAVVPEDISLATDDEVRAVQEEARRLIQAQALQRTRATLPSIPSMSSVLRINRVEGFAVGGGVRQRFGAGLSSRLIGRVGEADREAKGELQLVWERANGWSASTALFRDYRDAGDEPETSLVRNSIAAQEFGSDYTQPFDTRGVRIALNKDRSDGTHVGLALAIERHAALQINAVPSSGRYEPTIAAARANVQRAGLTYERPRALVAGFDVESKVDLRLTRYSAIGGNTAPTQTLGRVYARIEGTRQFDGNRLVTRLSGGSLMGGAEAAIPAQELLYAGGMISAPGYAYHSFRSTAQVAARVEWQQRVPFLRIPLGRWGAIPGSATLAPYVGAIATRGPAGAAGAEGPNSTGSIYPFVGIGAVTLFDLIRLDIGRGLSSTDGGRLNRWTFGVDVSRAFWPIL